LNARCTQSTAFKTEAKTKAPTRKTNAMAKAYKNYKKYNLKIK